MVREIDMKEYENIRDEAKEFLKNAMKTLPGNFTLLHLECLEKVMPEVTEELLLKYKGKVTLNQSDLLQ